jgi:hypothetical protein
MATIAKMTIDSFEAGDERRWRYLGRSEEMAITKDVRADVIGDYRR